MKSENTGKKRFGELLVESGLLNETQLGRALLYQSELCLRNERVLLGSILTEMGIVTATQMMNFTHRRRIILPLGELLVMDKQITRSQLNKAMETKEASPGKKLGEILVNDLNAVSRETLLRTIAKQHGISRIKPVISDVDSHFFFGFPLELLKKCSFIPYQLFTGEQGEASCIVVVSDVGQESFRKMTQVVEGYLPALYRAMNITPRKTAVNFAFAGEEEIRDFVANADEYREALSFYGKNKKEQYEKDEVITVGKNYYSSNANLNIFMRIIMHAIDAGASDIHIEPMRDRMRVRFRIDGVLVRQPDLPKSLNVYFVRGLKNYFKFKDSHISNLIVDDRKRIRYADRNIVADLRISILPIIYGEKMVIRILTQTEEVPTFESLGMCRNLLEKYKIVCSMSSGIVLITGPTGSGKTTTLFSTLDYLNNEEKNIVTIEDPPEYLIEGVNQAKVSGSNGKELFYADALKSVLRQDPDIIMFGEMRDNESASVALTAGLTGHLLFTTLHTSNAASAITRLFDMGIRPYLLSSTLVSILAQRLVRVICPECKEEHEPDKDILNFFNVFIKNFRQDIRNRKIIFHRGRGCDHCHHTGYKGRIAIHELLCVNDEIRKAVLRGATAKDAEDIARRNGMTSVMEDGMLKVAKGITTVEEIARVAKTLENPKTTMTISEIEYLLEGPVPKDRIFASIYTANDYGRMSELPVHPEIRALNRS